MGISNLRCVLILHFILIATETVTTLYQEHCSIDLILGEEEDGYSNINRTYALRPSPFALPASVFAWINSAGIPRLCHSRPDLHQDKLRRESTASIVLKYNE
jgi:hypothetical protein